MADDVRFPVYVLAKDCGEFTEYRSLADMRGYMEAIGVENNEYDAWDAEGFVLKLIATDSKREWLRLERRAARISEVQRDEVRSQASPYVNGRRLNAKG